MQFMKFLKSRLRTFGTTRQGLRVVTKTNIECGTFYGYMVFYK
jgi:hypothetical protein